MLTPKQIQDEQYWKDAWDHAIKYQSYKKETPMLSFTIGEDGAESMQGTWLVTETHAGDASRLFVTAEKDGEVKKLWVSRSWLTEELSAEPAPGLAPEVLEEAPAPAEEEAPAEEDTPAEDPPAEEETPT